MPLADVEQAHAAEKSKSAVVNEVAYLVSVDEERFEAQKEAAQSGRLDASIRTLIDHCPVGGILGPCPTGPRPEGRFACGTFYNRDRRLTHTKHPSMNSGPFGVRTREQPTVP